MYSRALGCLLAGACGDALGYPVEFITNSMIKSLYGSEGITTMVLVSGDAEVSDDTQMAIYTSQGLIEADRRKCNYHDTVVEVHKSYLRWNYGQTGAFGPNALALYKKKELLNDVLTKGGKNGALRDYRAPGNTCVHTLSGCGFCTKENPKNNSKGCGTVMRVAPVAIAKQSLDEAYNLGCDTSALTHGHVLGWASGGALVAILHFIFEGSSIEQAIQQAIQYCETKPECATLIPVMKNAVQVAKEGLTGDEAFERLGKGFVAEEALAIAMWASLMYPNDVRRALIAAVNHSGDSDSTGCVAGYIVGAANGAENVPKDWLEHLELKDVIEKQVKEMLHMKWIVC